MDWEETNKYQELCNSKIKVENIFMTNNYKTQEKERVPIINWLGQEGLRLRQTLNDQKQKNVEQAWD